MADRSSASDPSPSAELAPAAPLRPAWCMPVTTATVDVAGADAGGLQRPLPRRRGRGRGSGSRRSAPPRPWSAALPGARQRSRNSSVAEAAAEVLGEHRGAGAVRHPPGAAAAPSPPAASSPLAGRPSRWSAATTSVGTRRRRGRPAAPRSPSAGPRRSRRPASAGRRRAGVDRGGVGLVEVGRVAVANHSAPAAAAAGTERSAEAGGLDAHGGGVLVVGGHGPGPFARRPPRRTDRSRPGPGGAEGHVAGAATMPRTSGDRSRRRSDLTVPVGSDPARRRSIE